MAKFKTVGGRRSKWFMIGVLIVFIILAVAIAVPGSRAKYQVSGSIDIVDGEVSYSFADLNVIAMYVDGDAVSSLDDSTYYSLDTDSSYCTINGEVDSSITLSWDTLTSTLSVSPMLDKGTKCYLYFTPTSTLSAYLVSTASSNGGSDTTLIQHTTTCTNGCAEDGKYRYSGGGSSSSTSVNNYICFGTSNLSTCLNDTDTYLFRIIEVDPDDGYVKIIKNTSYGYYYWNGTDQTTSTAVAYDDYLNYWAVESTLYATLATTLNTTYLNTFSSSWQNLIATYNWNVGGSSTASIAGASFYTNENSVTATFKIGLMNVYDYAFAVESDYWSTKIEAFGNVAEYDWLFSGVYEWTIARLPSDTAKVFVIYYTGYVNVPYVIYYYALATRPSFYLKPSAVYLSGSGTSSDPILIQ